MVSEELGTTRNSIKRMNGNKNSELWKASIGQPESN